MATSQYKVTRKTGNELEEDLNALATEGWRPILISPVSFGGASWINAGPSRVDNFCVVLQRD